MKKWNIGWGPIAKCNMKCQFCYSKNKRQESNALNQKDWINFVDNNGMQINTINYGTGENTLSNEWFYLVKYIRQNLPEIRQSLTTNGHLAEALKNKTSLRSFIDGIDEVDVSLDFCHADNHNAFRGQPKAYEWAIKTLEICQYYGKPCTIVFLGSEINSALNNIEGLFSIAEKYGAILRMNIYRPTEGLNEKTRKFVIKRETLLSILQYIDRHHRIIAMDDPLLSSWLTGKTISDPSGYNSLRILADGNITPSTYLIEKNFVIGNIKDNHVLSRLFMDNKLYSIAGKKTPKDCIGCLYEHSCSGGVIDRRWLWYGTLDRKDPYCPGIINANTMPRLSVTNINFHSVHDGYLPTIFFKPGKEG